MLKKFVALLVAMFGLSLLMIMPLGLQAQGGNAELEGPLGEMVDVDGRMVHVYCIGEGSPTVWLENGWSALVLSWQPFQEVLSEYSRVCSYDRAGYGWSEANGIDRSAQAAANEFAALLDVMGEEDPFVLAAWSGGGLVSQIYAANHPDKVLGLALIEGLPPTYDLWATQTFPNQYWQGTQESLESVRGYAEQSAAGELTYDDISWWFNEALSERYGDYYHDLILENPDYWYTYYWETQMVIASGAQVQAAVSLTDMPMKVIISSQLPKDDLSVYRQTRARMWQTLQHQQASLSTNSEVIWSDTGHAVFREDPELVVNAILALILGEDAEGDDDGDGADISGSAGVDTPKSDPTMTPTKAPKPTNTPAPRSRGPPGMPEVGLYDLPPEALDTIDLIYNDGPFPFDRDGITFQNREGLLPDRNRGYYQEFTVITPGLNHRGARRVIAGREGELYYTDDHYESFSWIVEE